MATVVDSDFALVTIFPKMPKVAQIAPMARLFELIFLRCKAEKQRVVPAGIGKAENAK